jgi:hypothetical protein
MPTAARLGILHCRKRASDFRGFEALIVALPHRKGAGATSCRTAVVQAAGGS